jgi:AraC family ethanolamine operon transcriptional activator
VIDLQPLIEAESRSAASFATPGMTRVAANDADEFGELMCDWDIDLRQLQPSTFSATILAVPLGAALICSGHYSQPLLQRVGAPDDCLSITRPGRGSGPVLIQGHEVQPEEVFVTGSGADCETLTRGALFPTAFSIKLDYLQAQTHWLSESWLLSSKSVQLHTPGAAWASNFLDTVEWFMNAVALYPDSTARADVRDSLLDTLLARINTLGAADSPISEDRETRSARRLAVQRARDYIHKNLTEPMRLSDLCKHARTQARSLEYGFHEVVGVSPIAYIRASRLHRARRLLRSTAVRTRSISEIALDCGFWHLSQFAVDYKRLFAESPSVTFRRTQAQLPRSERRHLSVVVAPKTSSPSASRRATARPRDIAVPC